MLYEDKGDNYNHKNYAPIPIPWNEGTLGEIGKRTGEFFNQLKEHTLNNFS